MSNLQIRSWFDQDRIAEAILGGEPYFLHSLTWIGDHDRLLVLRQLIAWADDQQKRERAAAGLRAALVTALTDDDAWTVYDVLWSYFIVAKSNPGALPVDFKEIGRWVDELETRTFPAGDEIAILRNQVRDRLPTNEASAWDHTKRLGPFERVGYGRTVDYDDQYTVRIGSDDHLEYLEGDVEADVLASLSGPVIRVHREVRFSKPFERDATDAERAIILDRVGALLQRIGEQYTIDDS